MKKTLLLVSSIMLVLTASCAGGTGITPTTTTPAVAKSQFQLEYLLFDKYPDFFWCDPDFYPIAREGIEEKNSQEQFPAIRQQQAEFSAIIDRLGLTDKPDYTAEEKLNIYREHKKLTRVVQMTASGSDYNFTIRVGEGQGFRIDGNITQSGQIRETKRETSFNTCPICLAEGTLIDTPGGLLPVEQLRTGMPVWTVDVMGNKAITTVLSTSKTPVPSSFQVIKVSLDDGRTVTASPGHPAADGRVLEEYRKGEMLDGSVIISVEPVTYAGETYDILPSGETGLYRANGILLKSTLTGR